MSSASSAPSRSPLRTDPIEIERIAEPSGKTYILKKFGAENYWNVVYVNFEKMTNLHKIFDKNLDTGRIITELGMVIGTRIVPGSTLMIFDEIQTCPKALTSLKYFCEDSPGYHIACASSLLGLLLHRKKGDRGTVSFPVGKVNRMTMYPMTFPEFLLADGKNMLYEFLRNKDIRDPVPDAYAAVLGDEIRSFLAVGGMPKAVDSWVRKQDISDVENIQRAIIAEYADDFSKYAIDDLQNLILIWNSVPRHLAKENRKFFFSHVKKGARAKDLEKSLQWLLDANIVHKVCLTERPSVPLGLTEDSGYFKIYMCDVGLLRAMAGFPAMLSKAGDDTTSLYRGAVTENFVHNELLALGKRPCFWRHVKNEVDFLISYGPDIVPLEVKSGTNFRASNLTNYCRQFSPRASVVVSMRPLKTDRWLFLPLYLVWDIDRYTDAELRMGRPCDDRAVGHLTRGFSLSPS